MKAQAGGIAPKYRDFLDQTGIGKRTLSRLFGSESYTKLQQEAGDSPNRLNLERTSIRQIMEQYALLVVEIGVVPVYAQWDQRGLRPTESGLTKAHGIKWSDVPARFLDWAASEAEGKFAAAISIVNQSLLAMGRGTTTDSRSADPDLARLLTQIQNWMPARRRNSEGEYKIELRKHLESLKYRLNEEHGDSLCDILVERTFALELKKDPNLQEYDRLFGQIARHLQWYSRVIVVIFDAKRGDTHDKFVSLVDRFLNIGKCTVDVICK